MSFLLDTHTFIWFMDGDSALSSKGRQAIEDINNKCFLSIASIWEIAIKSSLGNLKLSSEFNMIIDFLDNNDIELLPISFEHLQNLLTLEYHHRDPFDRIIIAQAIAEDLTIISKDEILSAYKCRYFW